MQNTITFGPRNAAGRHFFFFILLVVFTFAPFSLCAQEFRATVTGEITDPSGAPIPAAKVTAIQKSTQRKYTAQSNSSGVYALQYLPPGSYAISAESSGFAQKVYSNVHLESAQKLNLNVELTVGSVHQQVTVTSSPGLVNSATASPGGVVDNAEVKNLPTAFGTPFDELMFTQGIRDTSFAGNSTLRAGTHNISAEGAPGGYNAFYIDGAPVSNEGNTRLIPSQDAVRELQVSVSPFDAQYGWMTGASASATLKSGSNHFHGNLYEHNEFTNIEANRTGNNATGTPRPEHIDNRYGGTLGGPIQKDKTFFFGSFEGWREAQPLPTIESVPTLAMRQGDFAGTGYTVYDPSKVSCAQFNTSGQCKSYQRPAFANDTIPQSDINPIGQAIANLYPKPNLPGTRSNYISNGPRHLGYDQYLGRVDHNFGQKTRIYGLYIHESDFSNSSGNGFPGAGSTQTGNPVGKNLALFDLTRTISPSVVLDFKVSFDRYVDGHTKGVAVSQNFTADKLAGLQMPSVPTTTHQNIAPAVTLSDYAGIFGNTASSSVQNNFYFSPSLAEVAGKHTLHYGFQYTALQYGGTGIPGQPNGEFGFNGQWSRKNPLKASKGSGVSVADLLLGYPDSGSLSWDQFNYTSFHYYGLYFQDDWKVRRNLTLNLGLRWDHYRPPTERYNRINGQFCPTCINPYTSQINHSTYPYLPSPLTGGFLTAGAEGQPRSPYSIAEDNWQPRVGFAWAITPKTVFRAGFGIYTNYGVNNSTSYGFSQSTSYIESLDNNINPSGYFASGAPYPNGVLAPAGASNGLETNTGQGITYFPSRWHIPWTQHWRADLEQVLPFRIAMDVAYAGSHTHGINVSQNVDIITAAEQQACYQDNSVCNAQISNPFYGVLPAATPLGSSATLPTWKLKMRQWPLFNGISLTNPAGYENYNALEVNVHRRVHTLDFVFNYTYSNWMAATSYLNNGSFRDPNLYYGLENNDWRHTLNGTVVWPLAIGRGTPFLSHAHGVLGGFINNWLVDLMWFYHTGSPLGVPAASLSGAPGCTSYTPPGGQTQAHWFNNNPRCYVNLSPYQPRTSPLRIGDLRNPAATVLDAALQKRFTLPWEGKFLQTRIEATNALNHWNMPGPDLNNNRAPSCGGIYCTGFGTIHPGGQTPRVVVLSMELLF